MCIQSRAVRTVLKRFSLSRFCAIKFSDVDLIYYSSSIGGARRMQHPNNNFIKNQIAFSSVFLLPIHFQVYGKIWGKLIRLEYRVTDFIQVLELNYLGLQVYKSAVSLPALLSRSKHCKFYTALEIY